MKQLFLTGILSGLLYFISLPALAQTAGIKKFLLEDENRPAKINVIFRDQQGYLWIGSSNGLHKFDGDRFTPIHFENVDYIDTVTSIFQEKGQELWIGFNNGRIARVIKGRLVYFNVEEVSPKQKITSFARDNDNNLWFATNGDGLFFLRDKHLFRLTESDGLSDAHVSSIVAVKDGGILAATDQGLNRIKVQGGKKEITVLGPRDGLPDYIVTSIIPSGNDQFWLGFADKGFCLYDHSNKQITQPLSPTSWSYGEIRSMILAQKNLWIATRDTILRYDTSNHQLIKYPGPFNNINSLAEDKQGNIWVTTRIGELIRTPGNMINILNFPAGIEFEHVHAILYDRNEKVWLPNKKNELLVFSSAASHYTSRKIMLPGVNEHTDITSLLEDTLGNIWVGTMGKGVYIINPVTSRPRPFSTGNILANASILSISGKGSSVFISSLQGSIEVLVSDTIPRIAGEYDTRLFNNKMTGTDYVYNIFKDSRNRIWFATDGKGIAMMDAEQFNIYDERSGELKDDRVYSIAEDDKGDIWFSTRAAGVYKFNGSKFTNYGIREGLSDLTISSIKKDKFGNIVIVHRNGLDLIDPQTGALSYINKNKGVSGLNVEDLAAVTQDHSGAILVSSERGIIVYSPSVQSGFTPITLIENVQLFLKNINDTSRHLFKYHENNFTFNYIGLYLTDPSAVYYQYKLEGLDTSWISTNDRSKTFPKLEPGSYVFRIRSSLSRDFIHAQEATYAFVIQKPYFAQLWFITACLFTFFLLLYLFMRAREKNLRKMERLRQEKVRFQFEILRNQVNPHFLFNSFNTLISTIEEDPSTAVKYAEKLSDFFRMIVNYRDKDIISLKEEVNLLKHYYYLQQQRYGNNLQLEIDLSHLEDGSSYIPPLTLQLLMENAIKHNVVSKETPLKFKINIEKEEWLIVSNTINQRSSKQAGAGLGLQNIVDRYALLTNKKVNIKKEGMSFVVSLPLIRKENV